MFFAAAVLFTFVTLPVEFGASKRALAFVGPLGLTGERADGARAVLRAAGWTYVAAALTALLTFLYYVTLVFGAPPLANPSARRAHNRRGPGHPFRARPGARQFRGARRCSGPRDIAAGCEPGHLSAARLELKSD